MCGCNSALNALDFSMPCCQLPPHLLAKVGQRWHAAHLRNSKGCRQQEVNNGRLRVK